MNLNLTGELDPVQSNDEADFKLTSPLIDWETSTNNDDEPLFENSMNCYGVVYIRLVRAQRLPCPVGSSVLGIATLPPFAGRIKTRRVTTFMSSLDHGVCVKWDSAKDEGVCSMVNAWNNEHSPVPSIKVSLMFSPLGMGLLDFTMCTLTLSCKPLLASPGQWKAQWCRTEVPDQPPLEETTPLIYVEALFAPKTMDAVKIQKTVYPHSPKRITPKPSVPVTEPTTKIDDLDASLTTAQMLGNLPAPNLDSDANDSFMDVGSEQDTEHAAHVLRVMSFWVPSSCVVCSTVMMGRNSGFCCEDCAITCCNDCRLNVDVEVPCGSEEARLLLQKSIRNKISLTNILSVVAPDAEYSERKRALQLQDLNESKTNITSFLEGNENLRNGIGQLRVNFVKARLFEQRLPPDVEPEDAFEVTEPLREGEYYARVTSSANKDKMAKTRPVFAGTPHFKSKPIVLVVQHYGEEFRFDCVDASTDTVVGSVLLTSQQLLQLQRDEEIEDHGASLVQCLRGPSVERGRRSRKLLLREGVNEAFGLACYVPLEDSAPPVNTGSPAKGAISGWLELEIGLEENVEMLYHRTRPTPCPTPPPAELDMAIFQAHIARARALFEGISDVMATYEYAVGWHDPFLTGLLLLSSIFICIGAEAEYAGCIPVYFVMMYCIYCSAKRGLLGRKEPFIRKEVEASQKATKVSVNYTLHRPVGLISVQVSQGRDLVSRDLGIPGQASCEVFFDPLYQATPEMREQVLKYDSASEIPHELGSTSGVLSADPEWEAHQYSPESKRLRQLLQQEQVFFDENNMIPNSLVFPILQPMELTSRRLDVMGRYKDGILKGWGTSLGAIIIKVRLGLAGFDQVLGEVVCPLSELVAHGEYRGWYRVVDTETVNRNSKTNETMDADGPRILVAMKWLPPESNEGKADFERDASIVVQEELVRSTMKSKEARFDLLGTTTIVNSKVDAALRNSERFTLDLYRALVASRDAGEQIQMVQNSIGGVLDTIERGLNLFNFTDPFKSSCVFFGLCVLAFLLSIVPTRYIVLAGIVGQFGSTLAERCTELSKPSTKVEENTSTSAFPVWISNALQSLPTNEDLRRAYFWEARRLRAIENRKFEGVKKDARRHRLAMSQWHAMIDIIPKKSSGDSRMGVRSSAFAILEGKRLLWWHTEEEFYDGELASGVVYFSGHAGITSPSPIEARELNEAEIPRTVSIFGKGSDGQQRVTVVLPDESVRGSLEDAVSGIAGKDD